LSALSRERTEALQKRIRDIGYAAGWSPELSIAGREFSIRYEYGSMIKDFSKVSDLFSDAVLREMVEEISESSAATLLKKIC